MSGVRILIVDDEETIRALLKVAVAAPGVDLFEAESGEHALDVAAHHAPFDLVITDILMPGMNGVDCATRLRDRGHADRFLFISGYCDSASLQARAQGIPFRFLAKPFSIPDLIAVVRGMLGEPQSETAKPRHRKASR